MTGRILRSVFAIFYLALMTGLFLSVHFCHEIPVSFTVNITGEEDFCGQEPCAGPCCDNESTFVKVEADHEAPASPQVNNIQVVAEIPFLTITETVAETHHFFNNYVKPPPEKKPRFISHCSLLFYA